MEEKYKILKLNDKELEILEIVLREKVVEYICEKNKPDFEEKISKDYDKYNKMHKEYICCQKILNIIEYLER